MTVEQKDLEHAAAAAESAVETDPAPKPPDEQRDDHVTKVPPSPPEEPLPGGKDDI